jgi:hypothetical protein
MKTTTNKNSSTPSVVSTSSAAVGSGFTLGLDLGDRQHHVCVRSFLPTPPHLIGFATRILSPSIVAPKLSSKNLFAFPFGGHYFLNGCDRVHFSGPVHELVLGHG